VLINKIKRRQKGGKITQKEKENTKPGGKHTTKKREQPHKYTISVQEKGNTYWEVGVINKKYFGLEWQMGGCSLTAG